MRQMSALSHHSCSATADGANRGEKRYKAAVGDGSPGRPLGTLLLLAGALAVSGCGVAEGTVAGHSSAVATMSPSASSSSTPSLRGNLVTLTMASSGETLELSVGVRIRLLLAGSAALPWGQAVSSDTRVLRPVPDLLMTPIPLGWVRSDFLVVAAGRATITAVQTPRCRTATPPCGMPSRGFVVTITATNPIAAPPPVPVAPPESSPAAPP